MNTYYKRGNRNLDIPFISKLFLSFLFVVALFIIVIFLVPERSAAAKNEPTGTYQILSVEIEAGDSLWSIATEYFTEDFGSVQSYISEIKRMNGLSSDTLYAGNYLLVPCYQ